MLVNTRKFLASLLLNEKRFFMSLSLVFMVKSSDIRLSTLESVGEFCLQWKCWVIAHLKVKPFWKYLKQALIFFVSPITFSSSTSTSSRLFAIMLIRSAKLFLSMHSPRCFTTNQSGKVSLEGKSIKRKYVFQLVWSMEVWFDKDIKSFACQAFLLSSSSPRHDFPAKVSHAIDLSWLAKDNSLESLCDWCNWF